MARDVKWGAEYSPRTRGARSKQRLPEQACTACAGRTPADGALEDAAGRREETLDVPAGVGSEIVGANALGLARHRAPQQILAPRRRCPSGCHANPVAPRTP